MKYLLLLMLIGCCNPSNAQEKDQSKPPVIVIRVPLGESAVVEGMKLTFVEVLEDSRCPRNVECIWAGRARVKIRISESDKEVIFGQVKQGEESDSILFKNDDFELEAFQVAPYPDEPGEQLDYVVLIRKNLL